MTIEQLEKEGFVQAVEWLLTEPALHGEIRIQKVFGWRLPRQPYMFKVMCDGACLNTDGDWEIEHMPSSRDDEFYRRCRFQTFDEAYNAVRPLLKKWGKR